MDEISHSPRLSSLKGWSLCAAVLLGPSVLVWTVRLAALASGCTPGPGLCRGLPLGAGLRDALDLAWVVPTSPLLLVALSLAATLLAFRARRPLTGTLSMLALPILTPMLPIVAVLFSRYDSCAISSDGLGACELWGAAMGMSFHNAAIARDVIFSIFPYTFALTMMLGVLGFCFARPKLPTQAQQAASMRHDDEPFE
jgi:hypothetical protein